MHIQVFVFVGIESMKEWHHVNSPRKKGGLKKVRRRSHTVSKTQFSVNMDDEGSVREAQGKRIKFDDLFHQSNGCCCILL